MELYILYAPQKAIKGKALADFLAGHPVPDDSPLNTDLPDEEVLTVEAGFPKCEIHFGGTPRTEKIEDQTPKTRSGAGVVFVTPQKGVIHFSFALLKGCSKNEAEYEVPQLLLYRCVNLFSRYPFLRHSFFPGGRSPNSLHSVTSLTHPRHKSYISFLTKARLTSKPFEASVLFSLLSLLEPNFASNPFR